jgi:hypothetical protein
MSNERLITPPPELVEQWCNDDPNYSIASIATRAAQWGADAELESCCVELGKSVLNGAFYVGGESCPSWHNFARKAISKLRAARRPKPPSLKEQALALIDDSIEDGPGRVVYALEEIRTIRRALEALPND